MSNNKLSEAEIKSISESLNKLDPGFLPLDLFLSITRLYTSSILELVPLRNDADGSLYVMLSKRPPDDRFWPDLLHSPGTYVMPTDKSADLSFTFDRLFKKELDGIQFTGDPTYSHYSLNKTKRGSEMSLVHFIEYEELPDRFTEMKVEDLTGERVIDHQIPFIKEAAENFLRNV